MQSITVGVFIYDNVELLDFAGPLEVFYLTRDESGNGLVDARTFALKKKPVRVLGGLQVLPDYCCEDILDFDYILIPGGLGAREMVKDSPEILFLKELLENVKNQLITVCTGSIIAALTGLYSNSKMTTHHNRYSIFEERFPEIDLVKHVKYFDDKKILSSGGISSGIDMTLYFVRKIFSNEVAERTIDTLEYHT